MRRRGKTLLKLGIGIAILLYLFCRIGFTSIATTMASINPICIPIVLCALMSAHAVHGLTLQILAMGHSISFGGCVLISLRSWIWGLITPARAGEISMIYYFKKAGIPIGDATAIAFLDRVSVLILIVSLAFFGAVFYEFHALAWNIVQASLVLIALIGSLLLFRGLREWIGRTILGRYQEQFSGFIPRVHAIVAEQPLRLFGVLIIQFLRLLALYAVVKLIFFFMGESVRFLDVCLISSIAWIVALLPISVNGLGIKEGVQVFLYSRYAGVNEASALAVAIWVGVILYSTAFVIYSFLSINSQKGD
jgi:uncharacterized protein (TIRG00374 family)